MAVNTGYEILLDTTTTADKRAEIVRRVLQALEHKTLSMTNTAAYSAGSTSTNQATITVGGATAAYAIRVIFDSAVIGTDEVSDILRILSQVLDSETLTIAYAASYTAGDRAYNHTITVT